MNLDDLIVDLMALRKVHGGAIEVGVPVEFSDHHMLNRVKKVAVVETKPHGKVFFRKSALNTAGRGAGPAFEEPYQSRIKRRKTVKLVEITDLSEPTTP